jgi:hypothetical protein
MEKVVTRDELVAYIDRITDGAKRRMKPLTAFHSLNAELIKWQALVNFDDTGAAFFCGHRFVRKSAA